MQNEKFRKELKAGLLRPLYFLWSKESFFLDEALSNTIEAVITPQQKDFNYDMFYPSASPLEILDAATTLPFSAPRRLVILRDFHQFSASDIKSLTPYFNKPCETTCMVLLSQKEPKADLKAFCSTHNLNIRENDIPAWLKQKAADKGIKMSESAVDYLIEYAGNDAGLLSMEIEKLAGAGINKVTDKDVALYTGTTRDYNSFNLIDALTAGQKTKAFRILKSLLETRPYDAARILGPLNWHYRQFYLLWENEGRRPLKMKNSTYRALLKYIPSFTQENFNTIFQNLHEADIGIKTSGRPELVLEILLVKLLQTGTGN